MIALVLLFGARIPGVLAQSDNPAIVRVVTTFFAEANAHDIGCGGLGDHSQIDKGAAAALFVERPSVTDVVPPWHWEGASAFKNWMADLATYCTRHDDADLKFTLAKPLSQEVEGDHGNVVVPLGLDFKEGGKPLHAEGLVNVVLAKQHDTWKIIAFTFTQK
jgi:ketosteroid isomerase-like protein